MTKASDNVFPRFLISEGGSTATPAAGRVTVYAKADGLLYQKDDVGTETLLASGASGAVATDAIWDAAGDLAVGSGANTAAKLTKGAAGAFLGQYNGVVGWNGGTSFPASPATGDRYWRSDLLMEGVYNGTRWLAAGPMQKAWFAIPTAVTPFSANQSFAAMVNEQDYDWWMYDLHVAYNVLTTNDGTKYWTWTVTRNGGGGGTVCTADTSAGAASTWTKAKTAIGALAGTTAVSFDMSVNKTSTPGNCYFGAYITYRLVLT